MDNDTAKETMLNDYNTTNKNDSFDLARHQLEQSWRSIVPQVGDKVSFTHKSTKWERFKSIFGFKIPSEDWYIVTDVYPNDKYELGVFYSKEE